MLRKDFIDAGIPKNKVPQYYDCTYEEVNTFADLCSKHIPWESGIWTSSLEWFFEEMCKFEPAEEVVAIMNTCLKKTLENTRYVPGQNNQSRYLYGILRQQVRGFKENV